HGLYLQFHLIIQLGAIAGEELEAVVFIIVVGGADDNACGRMEGSCEVSYGRGWHGAEQLDVHTRSGKAGFQGRLEHVSRDAGIFTNQHPAPEPGKYLAGRPAQFKSEIGSNRELSHSSPN